MAFDFKGARKAGYSDEDIGAHLNFDYAGARAQGYSDEDINAYLDRDDETELEQSVPTEQVEKELDEIPLTLSRLGKQSVLALGQGVASILKFARGMEEKRVRRAEEGQAQVSFRDLHDFSEQLLKIKRVEGVDHIDQERLNEEKKRFAIKQSLKRQEGISEIIDAFPELMEGSSGIIEDAVVGMLQFAPTMGVTAASPQIGAAMTYAQLFGMKYDELRKEGIDEEVAFDAATLSAVAQTPIEMVGNLFQLGALKNLAGAVIKSKGARLTAGRAAEAIVKNAVGEGAEEFLQQFPDEISSIYARNADKEPGEIWEAIKEELPQIAKAAPRAALTGAVGGALLGGAGAIASTPGIVNQAIQEKRAALDPADPKDAVVDEILADQEIEEERAALIEAIPQMSTEEIMAELEDLDPGDQIDLEADPALIKELQEMRQPLLEELQRRMGVTETETLALPPGQGFELQPGRRPTPEREIEGPPERKTLPPGQGFALVGSPMGPVLVEEERLEELRTQLALPPGQGFVLQEGPKGMELVPSEAIQLPEGETDAIEAREGFTTERPFARDEGPEAGRVRVRDDEAARLEAEAREEAEFEEEVPTQIAPKEADIARLEELERRFAEAQKPKVTDDTILPADKGVVRKPLPKAKEAMETAEAVAKEIPGFKLKYDGPSETPLGYQWTVQEGMKPTTFYTKTLDPAEVTRRTKEKREQFAAVEGLPGQPAPQRLKATETEGEGGVRRFDYTDKSGRKIGNARMVGTTIGDIEVSAKQRRKGYGTEILQDLILKGGVSAYRGSDAGAAMLEKAGMIRHPGGRYVAPKKPDTFAREELENIRKVLDVEDTPAMIAKLKHGTGAVVDQFETKYIGSGEGATAFGWGLYFTEEERIARHYARSIGGQRHALNIGKNRIDDVTDLQTKYPDIAEHVGWSEVVLNAEEVAKGERTKEEVLSDIDDFIDGLGAKRKTTSFIGSLDTPQGRKIAQRLISAEDEITTPKYEALWKRLDDLEVEADLNTIHDIRSAQEENAEAQLAWLKYRRLVDKGQIAMAPARHVYEVSLHKGKDPSEYTYLEWYKPVPKEVRRLIREAIKDGSTESRLVDSGVAAGHFRSGQDLYRRITEVLNSKEEASKYLLRAGVDGIKYPIESLTKGKAVWGFEDKDGKPVKYSKRVMKPIERVIDFNKGDAKSTANTLTNWSNMLEKDPGAFKDPDIVPEHLPQYREIIKGLQSGDLVVADVRPSNYVVFDENAITLEDHYAFSLAGREKWENQPLPEFKTADVKHVGLKQAVKKGLVTKDEAAIIDGIMEMFPQSWKDHFEPRFSEQQFAPTGAQLAAHGVPGSQQQQQVVEGALITEKVGELKEDANHVAVMFNGRNVDVFLHEFGEFAYKRLLGPVQSRDFKTVTREYKAAAKAFKKENPGKKFKNKSEWFADGFRDWWLRNLDGKSTVVSKELRSIFRRVMSAIKAVADRLRGAGKSHPLDHIYQDIIVNGKDLNEKYYYSAKEAVLRYVIGTEASAKEMSTQGFFKNAKTFMSWDPGSICPKKRNLLEYVAKHLSDGKLGDIRDIDAQSDIWNELINPDFWIRMYDQAVADGIDVPCSYCYVEQSRRLAVDNFIRGKSIDDVIAAKAKPVYETTPYNPDPKKAKILRWGQKKIDDLNRRGGLRLFSFSDYVREWHHDQVETVLDHAAQRGLSVKAITKTTEFVEDFGDRGIVINVSIDDGVLGQNGGMPWDEALRLKKKFPENVKVRVVAMNLKEYKDYLNLSYKGMDQFIDVITPYHHEDYNKPMPAGAEDFKFAFKKDGTLKPGNKESRALVEFIDGNPALDGDKRTCCIVGGKCFHEKHQERCASNCGHSGRLSVPRTAQEAHNDRFGDRLWDRPVQDITSADTSINRSKLPKLHSRLIADWQKSGAAGKTIKRILDLGGGKFDNATEAHKKAGITSLVYDPFNRTEEHNDKVIKQVKANPVDAVVIANVLNVIEERGNQVQVLRQAYNAVAPGGAVHISVYEGNKSGKGKVTKKGFQQNKPLKDYMSTVKKVFKDASIEKGSIVAYREAANEPSASPVMIQAEATIGERRPAGAARRIAEARAAAARAAAEAREAPIVEEVKHIRDPKKNPITDVMHAESQVDGLRRKFQDQYLPIKRVEEWLAERGEVIRDESPYLIEELSTGKAQDRMERFEDETVRPLMEAIRKSKITVEELEDYLYARHAPERNEYIHSINPKEFGPGEGSGMTDTEAAGILKKFKAEGKTAELQRLEGMVRKISNEQRAIIREAGLETAEVVEAWERYENYIPLKGVADEEVINIMGHNQGLSVKRSGTKRALGRQSRATDLLANLFSQTAQTIQQAERAKIGQAFLDMVEKNPNENMWTIHKPGTKPKKGGYEPGDYRPMPTMRAYVGGKVKRVPDPKWASRGDVFSVTRDGEVYHIQVAQKELGEALNRLNQPQVGKVVHALASINRYLSTINTSFNPEFIVTNFQRDIQTAMIRLAGEKGAQAAKDTLKYVPGAMKGIRDQLRGEGKSEMAAWYRRFKKAGGQVGWMDIHSTDRKARQIQRLAKDGKGTLQTAKRVSKALFDVVADYNTVVENAVRLSAFRAAIESGVTEPQAASLAKNLTVNFNRKGQYGTAMNAMYLFYNAGIQGSAVVIKSLRHKNVRRIGYGLAALGFGLAEMNRLVGGEDDDGVDKWDKINPYMKQRHYIMMLPDGEQITVMLPYGFNVFVAFGHAMNDVYHNLISGGIKGKTPAVGAAFMAVAALDAFNPIGGSDGLLKLVSPTVVDPFIEIAKNENFMGGPIRPDQLSYGPKRPDSQLYWNSARPTSKALTRGLNALFGGNLVEPAVWEFADISPETLDHLWDFATGGTGRFYADTAGLVAETYKGKEVPTRRKPFVRKIVKDQNEWYDYQTFRANSDRAIGHYNRWKILSGSEKLEYSKKHPEWRMFKLARNMQTTISKLNRSKRKATSDQQKKSIEKRIRGFAMDFNRRFNQTVRKGD